MRPQMIAELKSFSPRQPLAGFALCSFIAPVAGALYTYKFGSVTQRIRVRKSVGLWGWF
jgi:hypothetical protein